jgi:HEAT repeat protein
VTSDPAHLIPAIERLLAEVPDTTWQDTLRRRALLDDARALREDANLVPVAEALEGLARVPAWEVGTILLDALALVRQTRAATATSGVSGKLERLPASGPWQTPVAVEILEPAAAALSRSGPNRDRPVWEAVDKRADLRLFSLLLRGLQDRHQGLADFIATRALPKFGKAALPELLRSYNPRGKAGDGRCLTAIALIDRARGRELCLAALDAGRPPVQAAALASLSRLAPKETCQAAVRFLRGKSRTVRLAAARALKEIGAEAAPAIPVLVGGLGDADYRVQRVAQETLEGLGPQTIPALLPLLQIGDNRCFPAMWILGKMGAKAKKAVPGLLRLLDDPGRYVLRNAAATLGRIGPAARAAVGELSRRLKTATGEDRIALAEALSRITSKPDTVVRVALESLAVKEWETRRCALMALEELGPAARAAVPALRKMAQDKTDQLQLWAVHVLGSIAPEG